MGPAAVRRTRNPSAPAKPLVRAPPTPAVACSESSLASEASFQDNTHDDTHGVTPRAFRSCSLSDESGTFFADLVPRPGLLRGIVVQDVVHAVCLSLVNGAAGPAILL